MAKKLTPKDAAKKLNIPFKPETTLCDRVLDEIEERVQDKEQGAKWAEANPDLVAFHEQFVEEAKEAANEEPEAGEEAEEEAAGEEEEEEAAGEEEEAEEEEKPKKGKGAKTMGKGAVAVAEKGKGRIDLKKAKEAAEKAKAEAAAEKSKRQASTKKVGGGTKSGEGNIPLMRTLLSEKKSDKEILKVFTARYKAAGITDADFIAKRVAIYKNIASK